MTKQTLRVLTEEVYNEYQKSLGNDEKKFDTLPVDQKANVAHTILQVAGTYKTTASFNDTFSRFIARYLKSRTEEHAKKRRIADVEEIEVEVVEPSQAPSITETEKPTAPKAGQSKKTEKEGDSDKNEKKA